MTAAFVDRPREMWLDARAVECLADPWLVSLPPESTVLVTPGQLRALAPHHRCRVAVMLDGDAPPAAARIPDVIVARDLHDLERTAAFPGDRGLYCRIENTQDLEQAAIALAREDVTYGLIDMRDETNIPLELLIARLHRLPVRLVKRVDDRAAGEVALRTLERGADGVLVRAGEGEPPMHPASLVASPRAALALTEWEVRRTQPVGVGDRVCIDSVAMLTPLEGMLVGSTCGAFALLCSETHPLPYMPLRPFRVNAGAVHSYALSSVTRTSYLSELGAGDEALAVATDGTVRTVAIGRVKIERRPLLLLGLGNRDVEGSVVVQDDWHVRIMGALGEPLSVTHCRPGTKLLGWSGAAPRHCGYAVEETLVER